jgi:hypothetical protein
MKTQPTPLYAIDRGGQAHQVIGWTETYNGKLVPVLVKLGAFGVPAAYAGDLSYMPEVPALPPTAAADAQTEIIQRMAGWPDAPRNAQAGAPGWHGR